MTIEDRLRQALADDASAVPAPADRWHEVEARAAQARQAKSRRRRRRRAGGLAVIGLAAAVAALIALPALRPDPPSRVLTRTSGRPTKIAGLPATTTPTTTHQTKSTTTSSPTRSSGYLPLYPFRSLQDVNSWQGTHRSGGTQPWHLDAGQTALSFAGALGYNNIDSVVGTRMDATGAHVSIGFNNPNGQRNTAAVVHLIRFGTGTDAPWEVVGTDDTDFTVTTPHYAAIVTSPATVGGRVTGVDENIRVEVFQQSSQGPLGQFCCLPAGGTSRAWSATVSFHGATDNVFVIAASTGGHLAAVERFTVTGVRAASAPPTPGL
jgi:hypothetical protein